MSIEILADYLQSGEFMDILQKGLKKYKSLPQHLKAAFWFLICNFLQQGISVITTPIFTRLMNALEYGEYNVFGSWMSIVMVIVTLNLFYGVYVQGLIKFEEKKDKYSSALQGLVLTMTLSWMALYLLGYRFWNRVFGLSTVQVLSMLVIIWTSAVFSFWSAEQRNKVKYRKLVLVSVAASLLKPFLSIFLVIHSEDKATARILGIAITNLAVYTVFFFVQMKKGKQFYSKQFWKYAVCFNIPLIPHYLSSTILSSMDRIMIRNMEGAEKAGIYSLAYSVSQVMIAFNQALEATLTPWIYKKIKSNRIQDLAAVAYSSFGIIAIVNLILIACAPEIIAIFAPSSYYEAIWVIPPVSMSVFFMFSYNFFVSFEYYFERTYLVSIASMLAALCNVMLNYIFIPIFGYLVAGYTTLLCYILYALFHYLFMNLICKKELHSQGPFRLRYIVLITWGFTSLSFLFLASYHRKNLRYMLITFIIVLLVIHRKRIWNIAGEILKIKK